MDSILSVKRNDWGWVAGWEEGDEISSIPEAFVRNVDNISAQERPLCILIHGAWDGP